MAFRVSDQIEKALQGERTRSLWYQGMCVRTGALWRNERLDLWFIETSTGSWNSTQNHFVQLFEDEAVAWLRSHGYRWPEAMSHAATSQSAVSGTDATNLPVASLSDPLKSLIGELRKKRARTQAALLEFMRDRESALFEDVAHTVHGDDQASDDAIRANVKRLNEALESRKLPIKLRVGSGFIFKEEHPE